MAASTGTRNDLYALVTDRIIQHLADGVRPWHTPWHTRHEAGDISRPLRHNADPYSGVNVLNLWLVASSFGYTSPYWLTYRQAKELGGYVKPGEHGAPVVVWSTYERKCTDENDRVVVTSSIPFLKRYTVFNADQCEGLPNHFGRLLPTLSEAQRLEHVDHFVARTGATIKTGRAPAYVPSDDVIQIPAVDRFDRTVDYYGALLHELAHWSGAAARLNRTQPKRFRSPDYAYEELVAELAAAYLCADLGVVPHTDLVDEQSAAYLGHWLAALKLDRSYLIRACGDATKAVGYLYSLQGNG